MKKIIVLLLGTMIAFSQMGCSKDDASTANSTPTADTTINRKNANLIDVNPSSVYHNQAVAVFSFTQTTITGASVSQSLSSSVNLQITNETNRTIHFDYNIDFAINSISWNYQNVATICPNSTINVGEISKSPGNISLGAITLQSVSITYQ